MDLRYLVHLASRGASNIHPLGMRGTGALLANLSMRDGQRILEIGCGTGATLVHVALSARVEAVGIDALPEMVRAARRRIHAAGVGSRARVERCGPGADLPFADSTFDRVYAESVLGFQDAAVARRVLSEIRRVLVPGGRFAANEAVWKRGVTREQADAVNHACLRDFGLRQAAEYAWDVDAWIALAAGEGLNLVTVKPLHAALTVRAPRMPITARIRMNVANALVASLRLPAFLSPRAQRERRSYARLLHSHKNDGILLEAYLMVFQRSGGT